MTETTFIVFVGGLDTIYNWCKSNCSQPFATCESWVTVSGDEDRILFKMRWQQNILLETTAASLDEVRRDGYKSTNEETQAIRFALLDAHHEEAVRART